MSINSFSENNYYISDYQVDPIEMVDPNEEFRRLLESGQTTEDSSIQDTLLSFKISDLIKAYEANPENQNARKALMEGFLKSPEKAKRRGDFFSKNQRFTIDLIIKAEESRE